jgi:hypothetical protein
LSNYIENREREKMDMNDLKNEFKANLTEIKDLESERSKIDKIYMDGIFLFGKETLSSIVRENYQRTLKIEQLYTNNENIRKMLSYDEWYAWKGEWYKETFPPIVKNL